MFTSKGVMEPIMRWEHNILGKQFPTFCPMGPTIATRDEIADLIAYMQSLAPPADPLKPPPQKDDPPKQFRG